MGDIEPGTYFRCLDGAGFLWRYEGFDKDGHGKGTLGTPWKRLTGYAGSPWLPMRPIQLTKGEGDAILAAWKASE